MTKTKRPDSRAAAKADREQRWRAEVELWTECGLSQAEFCRRRSLSVGAFRWWVQELKRRGQKKRTNQRSGSRQKSAKAARVRRSQEEILGLIGEYEAGGLTQRAFAESKGIERTVFGRWLRKHGQLSKEAGALVAVRVRDPQVPEEPVSDRSGVELILSCGHTVRVHPDFDADTLTRLIQVMEERC